MSSKKEVTTKNNKKINEKKKVVEISPEKRINPKNYLYSLLILVGGIILALLIFKWYNVKKEERLMVSYLISSNTIESSLSDINSIDYIKQEAPSSYFIYFGYTKDEDVYNFEVELKKLIDKYKLNDVFYYVDLTKYNDNANKEYIDLIKQNLGVEVESIPALIYIENGVVEEVLDGVKDTKLKIADIEKLLDIYGFETIK